jgi:hypothetical protein
MASKSPLNIIEDALRSALVAETSLAAYTIRKGQTAEDLALPSIVISCESATFPPGLAQGLGNYLCRVRVGIFTQVDDQTLETHRTAAQDVMGKLDDLVAIKAAFTALADAHCYDCTMTDLAEDNGDRCFMTSLSYDVMMVLPAV